MAVLWFGKAQLFRMKILHIERHLYFLFFKQIFKFHAVSRSQQVRQRELSVETFPSRLAVKYWRRGVLSGGTQRH